MIPVLTPDEVGRVDAAAASDGLAGEVLVGRAGEAVARGVVGLLRQRGRPATGVARVYGRRVVVVAGRGNNGADGRTAARLLARRGLSVRVVEAADTGAGVLPDCDVVVDAAYGTGLRRPWTPPQVPAGAAVVAVDIPSGLDGLTGAVPDGGGALPAALTVTFAALKPGLLLGTGPDLTGPLSVADIGLDRYVDATARAHLVEDGDVDRQVPPRRRDGNKYDAAVTVVAGSPGMYGAPWYSSLAAMRAGAGYVRLGIPGVEPARAGLPPTEAVLTTLPEEGWSAVALEGIERSGAVLVGPGLDRRSGTGPTSEVGRLLAGCDQPAVVDADGLAALGDLDGVAAVARGRRGALVLTPHAGEFARLVGAPPGTDRVASVREAAARSGAVVLLKGSTTVVAHPDGRVLLAAAGSSRLATAGSGDVLAGVIAALLARGVPALEAAALGAHVHGRAADLGRSEGLVASDLPDLVADWLAERR